MRKNIVLLLTFFSVLSAAQNVNVKHVYQEGKDIVVVYDLKQTSFIQLNVIFDGKKYVLNDPFDSRVGHLKGDVGLVSAGSNKRIEWIVLDQFESFVHDNVQFEVLDIGIYTGNMTFILCNYAYGLSPQHSFGFSVGQVFKGGQGWYLKFRSNFKFQNATNGLKCEAEGLVDGSLPFYSGVTKNSHIIANAGYVFDFFSLSSGIRDTSSMLGVYAGAGYGQRWQVWETTDSRWVKYAPTASQGLSLDTGILGSIKGYTFMVGINTINFKYLEFDFGLGWTIAHKKFHR